MPHHHPTRRHLLQSLALGVCSAWAAPAVWAQNSPRSDSGRLVIVFLRGAYDGLSALVPHGDEDYYRIRPTIAIAPPDGSAKSAIQLDTMFGLNPAMAALLPLWEQGVLAALPSVGSPHGTRSHFDAQYHWEIGVPGKNSPAPGWMNTLASLRGDGSKATHIIGVGEANPRILAGPATTQLVPKGDAATRKGVLGDSKTNDAVRRLYSGNDMLSEAFRSGAESRTQTADILKHEKEAAMDTAQMMAANNGAGSTKGLITDARNLGTLMKRDRNLRLGFVSAGGWDTHANQGPLDGNLGRNLGNLATALVQLRRDFSEPNDMVVVCSEFGRTSAENGTRGTDHGHGNAMWLMGNRVQGGRWHGNWTGLAKGNLNEGRDLPVHHDFRAILAQVLRATQGLNASEIDKLFPGFTWDSALDGLMRA